MTARTSGRIPRGLAAVLALTSPLLVHADINAVAFSPDGALLAVGGRGMAVMAAEDLAAVWDTAELPVEVRGVAFSPGGGLIAAASRDRLIRVWSAQGELVRSLEGHGGSVNAVAFGPAEDRLVSAASDRTVRVWDLAAGETLLTLEGHTRPVHGVAVSPDGALVASASADETVRLWDAVTGELLRALEGHTSSVWSVAFSPDGRTLASGSWDRTVRLWEVETGRLLRTLAGHDAYVRGVAFSPDGAHVASASWDRCVRVWDARSGEKAAELRGHRQPVRALAFHPDGTRLASGALYEAQSVRVWENVPRLDEGEGVVIAPEGPPPPARQWPEEPLALGPERLPAWRNGTHPQETRAAIQAALDAARQPDGPGPVVTLPPGEYLITDTLNLSGITLRGPGASIRARNDGDSYLFGLALGAQSRLESIAVVGEGPRCVPVRFANPARDVTLRDVHIRGGTILLNGQVHVDNILIDGCTFEGGGYGFLLDQPSTGRNVRVVNCTFRGNRSDAIELNFPRHREGKLVEDIVIAGNVFEDTGPDPDSGTSGFGVGIAGARSVQITGNAFRRMAVQAVHVEDWAEHITITGNNMLECGLDHTGGNWTGGVHLLPGTRYVTVSGNNFSNCRFGVSGLQGNSLQWCTVVGNTFRNSEKGLWIMEFPHGIIQGNLFEDCRTAVEIWRSRLWTVSGNQIVSARPGSVGVMSTRFMNIVLTGNTIRAETPVVHREPEGDLPSLVEGNLILDHVAP